MKSVPRGSGWVRQLYLSALEPSFAPTRYREVVLTPSRRPLPTAVAVRKNRGSGGEVLYCFSRKQMKAQNGSKR